jgi:hypothetical protein
VYNAAMRAILDALPLWLVFAVTAGIILLSIELGFRGGLHRARQSEDERQAPVDAMVGSTLGLLAFVLAFTFGMATSRYDARQQLVLDDANAIRAADLRAQLLAEPDRDATRTLLREYVDVRIKGVLVPDTLSQALTRSAELHDQLWSRASTAPLQQALIQVMDVHSKRMTAGLQNRLPPTIWLALYSMAVLAMAMAGYRAGLAGRRSIVATLALGLAFSAVIVVIADLDRPQEGLLKVSQQALLDLQARLHAQ